MLNKISICYAIQCRRTVELLLVLLRDLPWWFKFVQSDLFITLQISSVIYGTLQSHFFSLVEKVISEFPRFRSKSHGSLLERLCRSGLISSNLILANCCFCGKMPCPDPSH